MRTNGKHDGALWECDCDCGATCQVLAFQLRSGVVKSCKCLMRTIGRSSLLTHGRTGTAAHRIWKGMRTRCNNPNATSYDDYGGRGIRVCQRWSKFENFLVDMGEPPPGHTIERDDNDGPYSPANCRWVPAERQALNRRSNRRLRIGSDVLPITEWCRRYGAPYHLVKDRIRLGWSAEDALTLPVGARRARK